MKRHTLTFLFLAGCVDEVPELPAVSEAESASTSTQGASYQGASYQGASYQGASYQGASYQGASYQGSSYTGAVVAGGLVSASINKTTITLTRTLPNGTIERRTPTSRCVIPAFGFPQCTTYNLVTQKSPLAGATFATTFIQDGVERAGTIRIRDSIGAVQQDTWVAMHPLTGMGAGAVVSCDHPNGCGTDSDLWLYQIDLVDTDNTPYAFCADGGKSMALAGTWNTSGLRTDLPGKLTFACTRGTIAKCTRWGYRPFGTGINSGGTSEAMAPYHQACIRAATADYCANGNSFTKDGTLIDIWDYQPHTGYEKGFIPRTLSMVYPSGPTAFEWESTFDRHGAVELDFVRYAELGSLFNACPNRFAPGTAPMPGELHSPATRSAPAYAPPYVSVDATNVCAHSEETLGRSLHPSCSKCTIHLWETFPSSPCVNGGPWDASCKQLALDNCHSPIYLGIYPRMALHSECTTGAALYKYDSACTMNLCGDPAYASCCSTGWTSACTAAANARCTGGREGVSPLGIASGFCGGSLPGGGGTIGGAVAP